MTIDRNHARREAGKFLTIREVANTGLLSELTLRRRVAEKSIPFIHTGNRVLINYPKLLEELDRESINVMEVKDDTKQ